MISKVLNANEYILVTGGAGYIGSHTVKALESLGYKVLILDNLVYGNQDIVESALSSALIVGDTNDRSFLDKLFAEYPIKAVIHFAAYAYVGESVQDPAKYYRNNVVGTLTLLEAMRAADIRYFVFSSTCATYGIPTQVPIPEEHPQNPINPYGYTKLVVERMLEEFDQAYGIKSVVFRYFNAAGADPDGLLGEDHDPEPHLIPNVFYTALGKNPYVSVLGTDYPTPDGTCIRDYIHVYDLARAHILGLEHLLNNGTSEIFNLSNGNGFSVREVISAAEQVTAKSIAVKERPRRPGDPAVLVGKSDRVKDILQWEPRYPGILDILSHAWHWHQKRHQTHLASQPKSLATLAAK